MLNRKYSGQAGSQGLVDINTYIAFIFSVLGLGNRNRPHNEKRNIETQP